MGSTRPTSGQQRVSARRAVPDDLETLESGEPRPELELARKRLDEQEQGTGIFAVVEVEGVIVGSGFLDFVDEELTPELKNLWVHEEARRQGAGRLLWRWLEARALEAGYSQVYLAVDPNNEKAIPLFLNLGYSPTGHHLFMEDPDEHQVTDPSQVSSHYAIFRKSLLAG